MINQAYDDRNHEDYEANTSTINNALLEISKNKKLKATVTQLSKMTGIHRNTITNRIWPVQKIKQIKEKRKTEDKLEAEQINQDTSSTQKSSQEILNQTQNEVIYWFNEYQDMKRCFEHSNKRFEKMRESRDYYKNLYEIYHQSLLNAEQKIEKLKETLELKGINLPPIRH